MNRKPLLALLLFGPLIASGATQAADKMYRVGFLVTTASPGGVGRR